MSDLDNYLTSMSKEHQAEFRRVQKIVAELTPKFEVYLNYGVPTFKVNGKAMLHFGGFKDHFSLFPASDEMVEAIGEVAKFRVSKGTLQFSKQKPLSDELLRKIVEFRFHAIS